MTLQRFFSLLAVAFSLELLATSLGVHAQDDDTLAHTSPNSPPQPDAKDSEVDTPEEVEEAEEAPEEPKEIDTDIEEPKEESPKSDDTLSTPEEPEKEPEQDETGKDSDEKTDETVEASERKPTDEEIRRIDDNFVSEDIEPSSPHIVVTPSKNPKPKAQLVTDEQIELSQSKSAQHVEKLPANKVNAVVLRVLDKISGKAEQLKIPTGETRTFRRLRILAHACKASKPTEAPEATAFLQIYEELPDNQEKSKLHYSGWMFASSPTVGALTHPVYDVWVETCQTLDKNSIKEQDAAELTQNDKD